MDQPLEMPMKHEGFSSILLDVICCRSSCNSTIFDHLCSKCCGGCSDCCWLWRHGGNDSKLRKEEIQYVIEKQCGIRKDSLVYTANYDASTSSSSGAVVEALQGNGNCGIDNEGCTETARNYAEDSTSLKDIKNELYRQIEMRRSSSISANTIPVIDWKSIQFWTMNTNREPVQPKLPVAFQQQRRYSTMFTASQLSESKNENFSVAGKVVGSSSILHGFCKDLYEEDESKSTDGQNTATTNASIPSKTKNSTDTAAYFGRIHFSVQYEIPGQVLVVKVIEACDLSRPLLLDDTKQDLAHSNPYVRICLLPDHQNAQQTSVKRKTQSPVFDESFTFPLTYREAQRRTLQLKVKDFDKYSKHFVIGQVLVSLDDINLVKGQHMWKDLQPCEKELEPDLGDILISLNYLPSAGRLNVDVIKAKQLLQTDIVGGSVPFVRISLVQGSKLMKSRKTSCKRNTIDPEFNEMFSFDVHPSILSEVSVVITVWDSNPGMAKNDFIGRVVIGQHSSGPNEITHWKRMLQMQRSTVDQWHTLQSRHVCDRLSPASVVVP
ncbi:Synaptotagmin-17 [Chamberlinius hualienensis]